MPRLVLLYDAKSECVCVRVCACVCVCQANLGRTKILLCRLFAFAMAATCTRLLANLERLPPDPCGAVPVEHTRFTV